MTALQSVPPSARRNPLQLDMDTMSLRDIIDLESRTGLSIGSLQAALTDDAAPKGVLMAAVAWINLRRERPGLTFDEAADTVTLADIQPGAAPAGPRPLSASTTDESPA